MPSQISTIVTELVFIILHFFLFYTNYILWGKKILQPAVLFCLVWTAILVLHLVFRLTVLDELYILSLKVQLVILAGCGCFSLGGGVIFLVSYKSRFSGIRKMKARINTNLLLNIILVAIIFVGLPFYIKASYQIFLASQAEDFFKGLRTQLTGGEADIGVAKYLMSLAYVVFAITLYSYYTKKSTINSILLILSFLSIITYSIFATGRTYFLIILSIYLGLAFVMNKNFSIKKLSIIVSIFLLIFMTIGGLYGKGASVYFSWKQNVAAATENLGIYLVTPINALDNELNSSSLVMTDGNNTLRFFIKIAINSGMFPRLRVIDLIQDYSYVPYATNVYSYYGPYNKDFGIFYPLFMLFFYSLLHCWLYLKAVATSSLKYMFYYSFLLYPLLLSFFSDQYLTLFSFWLQIIFFIELYSFLNKMIIKMQKVKILSAS